MEASKLRHELGKDFCLVTPGIRLAGDSKGDQRRVMTPKQAFQNGATSLVMGRSLIKGKIEQNIKKLVKELS